MLCSAISRLSLHPISRFGFVRNCGFSTRRSLALAHSLIEAKKFLIELFLKKFVVFRGKAFGHLSQRAKHPKQYKEIKMIETGCFSVAAAR